MSPALALLKSLRPHQWVKNVFVMAPLVFARQLTNTGAIARAAAAVAVFSVLAGAVYTFNDVRDVEADRAHPTKRRRPIASGALTERAALISAAVLAAVALACAYVLRPALCGIAGIYLLQNVAYSVRLKQIAFVDVALITSGFLLRVLAGAVAIAVPASGWLLVCTGLLATFLGLGKRAHELAWAARDGEAAKVGKTRAALAGYRLPVVRIAMFVIGTVTVAAYVAYTFDAHTVRLFGSDRLALSTPFVVMGIFRFLQLALWYPKDEPPTEAMLRDVWFLLDLAAAVATIVYIIYG